MAIKDDVAATVAALQDTDLNAGDDASDEVDNESEKDGETGDEGGNGDSAGSEEAGEDEEGEEDGKDDAGEKEVSPEVADLRKQIAQLTATIQILQETPVAGLPELEPLDITDEDVESLQSGNKEAVAKFASKVLDHANRTNQYQAAVNNQAQVEANKFFRKFPELHQQQQLVARMAQNIMRTHPNYSPAQVLAELEVQVAPLSAAYKTAEKVEGNRRKAKKTSATTSAGRMGGHQKEDKGKGTMKDEVRKSFQFIQKHGVGR